MHKKSFRLFITTLLLSLTFLVGGCGASESQVVYAPVSSDSSSQTVDSIDNSNGTYSISTDRFSAERVKIDGIAGENYIITDTFTGVQYLYIYASYSFYEGGPAITVLEQSYNN